MHPRQPALQSLRASSGTAPATDWSLITAASGDGPAAREALNQLCRLYWPVARGFMLRKGRCAEDADELTQQLFLDFVRRGDLSKLTPGTRFRSWFYQTVRHCLANHYRARAAAIHGAGRVGSLEQLAATTYQHAEPRDLADAEWAFDNAWAIALLERTQQQLRALQTTEQQQRLFECAVPFLAGPEMSDAAYAPIASELELSQQAFRTRVARLRQHHRELLRHEIRQTVDSDEQVAAEWRALYAALQRPEWLGGLPLAASALKRSDAPETAE